MADKSIFELNLQTTFATNDRLVVGNYANSDAEAITGQTLVNLLATSLDGHGGIQSIVKTSSSGTDPVVDTYTITMADTTTTTFTVTNGLKGDQGNQTYVYFRWAHTEPTSWSDTTSQPDEWMGVYAGTATTPPTTVSAYTWVRVRGDTGETGEAASISSQSVTYMESTSGTIVPSGSWSENVPIVTPGNFLWTRTQLEFNDESVVTSYSVSRYGIDGTGSVSTVNNVPPDTSGNIALTASNIPTSDNQSVQTHLDDVEDVADAAQTTADNVGTSLATYVRPNLLDNWYFVGGGSQQGGGQFPINQRGQTSYTGAVYGIDRWKLYQSQVSASLTSNGLSLSRTSGDFVSVVQYIEVPENLDGKTVTLSMLFSGTYGRVQLRNSTGTIVSSKILTEDGLASCTTTLSGNTSGLFVAIYCKAGETCVAKAIKLEIGSTQTLAHQENGAWVLNEMSKFSDELLRCQRYYQLFRTQSLRPTYAIDFRPCMASDPTLDTVTISSTTYYTASADL